MDCAIWCWGNLNISLLKLNTLGQYTLVVGGNKVNTPSYHSTLAHVVVKLQKKKNNNILKKKHLLTEVDWYFLYITFPRK